MDSVLLFQTTTAQTTSADRFSAIYNSGVGIFSANVTSGQTVMPCDGTLSKLFINCDAGPGAGLSRTFKLYKNGADTGLSVTLTGAGTGAGVSSGSDTSNSVSFSAGDTLSLKTNATGTTTSTGVIRGCLKMTCAANVSAVLAITPGNIAGSSNTTNWVAIQSQGSSSVSSAEVEAIIPTGGTFKNAYGVLNGSPSSGKSYTFTLVVNGTPTSLSFTISNTATAGSDTNGAHAVSVSPGDRVWWEVTPSGGPTNRTVAVSAEFDPAIDGESIHTYGTNTLNTNSATRFSRVATAGQTGYGSSEPGQQALTIAAVWKKLYVRQQAALSQGSYKYSHNINGQNLSISSANVTLTTAGQTGDDSANSAASADGDTVAMQIAPTGTPTAVVANWGIVSYIAPPAGGGSILPFF